MAGGIWRFNHGNSSPTLVEDGGSLFLGVSGELQSATEADVQLKVYHQYIFKSLNAEVSTQDGDATYEFALSVDGTPSTNLVVPTIGSGFTEDLTGSELVAADSLVNYIIDGSAGMHGDNVAVRQAQVSYENASLLAPIFAGSEGSPVTSTRYLIPGIIQGTTEAENQLKVKRSTTYKNLRVVNLQGTVDFDVAPTKDGVASTNVTVNVVTTGAVEDVTGSELFIDGELFGIEQLDTSGTLQVTVLQIEANTFEDWKVAPGGTLTAREYNGFNYRDKSTTASDHDPLKSRVGTVLGGNLQTYLTNAGSGSSDLSLRVGGIDSTNVSLVMDTTGFIEDVTGTETILDGDGAILTHASVGDSVIAQWSAVEIPHTVSADITPLILPIIINQAIQRASVF